MFRPSAGHRFILPAIPNSRNIFSIRTIIRCSIPCGSFMSMPSGASVRLRPCLNGTVSREANRLIKPNARLTSTERLNIYHRQYWYRILDSFNEDFPGLRAILGERGLDHLSHAYLNDCPSQSFTLRNLGSRLETWLREHSDFAVKNLALALDMIGLEWAHIEAFDNAERQARGPEDLLELGPEMAFALQPHIRLLELHYPVDELRIKVSEHSEEHGAASNAVSAPAHRHMLRRYARLKPQQI